MESVLDGIEQHPYKVPHMVQLHDSPDAEVAEWQTLRTFGKRVPLGKPLE